MGYPKVHNIQKSKFLLNTKQRDKKKTKKKTKIIDSNS